MGTSHIVMIFILSLSWGFSQASADENLLGYVKGAETLPRGVGEVYQVLTLRSNKGAGDYQALDSKTIGEYGWTDSLTVEGALKMQSIETKSIRIDGYVPGDESYGLRPSGIETSIKYNFLSPAKDDIGFSTYLSLSYDWLDMHSGQGKDKKSLELVALIQKYFLEGELIWVANIGMETTHADRDAIDNLPSGFDWPTEAEMEIELLAGLGLSYRFVKNWYLGVEAMAETEFETEVNQERWSIFGGPSVHYGDQKWWATISWFPQLKGGGEKFDEQDDRELHLIEKTKQEYRLKLGYNF